MDCPVRVSQLARVEQGHDGRQQGRSISGGVACYNLVAVLVGPEAQGQPTTRRRAVVAERPRLSSAPAGKTISDVAAVEWNQLLSFAFASVTI